MLTKIVNIRLKLKAKLRHNLRSPGNVELRSIQTDREALTTSFLQLKQLQHLAGVAEENVSINLSSEEIVEWDDLAFDPVITDAESISINSIPKPARSQSNRNSSKDSRPVPIEDQVISLPSNGNSSSIHAELEISYRIVRAEELLNHIRNLIAEKSFQFSHVIRVSPRKGVTTRARAAVKKLNNQIAEVSRFYVRCRSSLLTLGASSTILSKFKVLSPVDVIGSTAVLDPNRPGSTSLKLSWIWQTSARNILAYAGPAASMAEPADDIPSVLEC